jgi:hypothetical protein
MGLACPTLSPVCAAPPQVPPSPESRPLSRAGRSCRCLCLHRRARAQPLVSVPVSSTGKRVAPSHTPAHRRTRERHTNAPKVRPFWPSGPLFSSLVCLFAVVFPTLCAITAPPLWPSHRRSPRTDTPSHRRRVLLRHRFMHARTHAHTRTRGIFLALATPATTSRASSSPASMPCHVSFRHGRAALIHAHARVHTRMISHRQPATPTVSPWIPCSACCAGQHLVVAVPESRVKICPFFALGKP